MEEAYVGDRLWGVEASERICSKYGLRKATVLVVFMILAWSTNLTRCHFTGIDKFK